MAGAPPDASAAARAAMSWAACCSGIALANAGLGAVHGIVAALGAAFPVPHGTGCGILLAATTRANLAALAARAPGSPALARYADAGRILAGDRALPDDAGPGGPAGDARRVDDGARHAAAGGLRRRATATSRGSWPRAAGSSMRTNPIVLTDEEIAGILAACL